MLIEKDVVQLHKTWIELGMARKMTEELMKT